MKDEDKTLVLTAIILGAIALMGFSVTKAFLLGKKCCKKSDSRTRNGYESLELRDMEEMRDTIRTFARKFEHLS